MNKKIDGVLRCMVCGEEQKRVPAGLHYGFPKHCGQQMRVITAQQLQEEREFYDRAEEEENYLAGAMEGGNGK